MITREDLNELRRIATNSYDAEKRFINGLIVNINNMEREIIRLKAEKKKPL